MDISYKDHGFQHLEQGFQHSEAVEAKNAEKIIKTTDPRDCKALGKLVRTDEHWNSIQDEVMEQLVEIKAQIQKVKEFLLKRGNKDLVEATGDMHSGYGVTFT